MKYVHEKKDFYSIGEVASIFSLESSTLRYWEKEFEDLAPKKDYRGNRLYTQKDINQIEVIYVLLKEKGYTLEGARNFLLNEKKRIEDKKNLISRLEWIKQELTNLKKILS